VLDVPLGGLSAGRYTVVVDAGAPVVASASFSRVGQPGPLDPVPRIDRADAAATSGGPGTVVVPQAAPGTPALAATLVVGAVGQGTTSASAAKGPAATGTVEVIGTSGQVLSTHHLTVDAGTTGEWPVSDLTDAPDQVAALHLTWSHGARLSWALVVQSTQDDGTLLTELTPVPSATGPAVVSVHDDPALGLG